MPTTANDSPGDSLSAASTSLPPSSPREPMLPAAEGGRAIARAEISTAAASTSVSYLDNPKPHYPESARQDQQQGLVVLRVLISSEGRPIDIRIDRGSGFRALDTAAVAGVKRWSFIPATQNQKAIEAWITIPIRFRLDDNAD